VEKGSAQCRVCLIPCDADLVFPSVHRIATLTGTTLVNQANNSVENTPSNAVPAETSVAQVRILVAEDNEINQMVVTEQLDRLGCHVTMANDGHEVVEMASNAVFDLILMDLSMPRMDGLAATRAIRDGQGPNRTTPIIAVTANAFKEDVTRCLAAGMNDHVAKPLKREVLAAVIRKHVAAPATPVASVVATN
jgi:CheY-like chemotaxis protein